MTDVAEAEARVAEAKGKLDYLHQEEAATLAKMRSEQQRLATLLSDRADERTLGKSDNELQRLTNRMAGFITAKQQATADLEGCERRLSQAVADQAKAELDAQVPALEAAARAIREGFRGVYQAWQVRRKLEEERLEIGRRANVNVQSSKGEILPRMTWYKSDVGTDHAFREWLQHLLEIAPLLPLHRSEEEA